MKTFQNLNRRRSESGNVLFLILIAVVLFAALSYAVTQSSRSGGGDANSETNRIGGAQLTQYPSGIRTAIVRMVINGTDASEVSFNVPADFENLCVTSPTDCNNAWGVFHPSGGGATYDFGSADVMAGGSQGTWHFNSKNQIALIGTSEADNDPAVGSPSADIVAFLSPIKQSVCEAINKKLGIASPVPTESGIDISSDAVAASGVKPGIAATNSGDTIGDVTTSHGLNGQPFGCFFQSPNYVYYHVLIER